MREKTRSSNYFPLTIKSSFGLKRCSVVNKKRKETLRRININEHHGRDQITLSKPTQLKERKFFPKTKTSHRSGMSYASKLFTLVF